MMQEITEPTVANFVQKSFEIIAVLIPINSERRQFHHHRVAPFWQGVHHQGHRLVRVSHPPPLLQAPKHQQLHPTGTPFNYLSSICTASTSPEKNPPKISSRIPIFSRENPKYSLMSGENSRKISLMKTPLPLFLPKNIKTNLFPKKSFQKNPRKPKIHFSPPRTFCAHANTSTPTSKNAKRNWRKLPLSTNTSSVCVRWRTLRISVSNNTTKAMTGRSAA